jgi:arsenate reductase
MTTIWHNPRCSKSRNTLTLLEEKGLEIEIIKYLDTPPSKATLIKVLKMLNIKPRELMRSKEEIYITLNLQNVTDENLLIEAMIANPKLIERPVVIKEGKAVIARPLENVLELL